VLENLRVARADVTADEAATALAAAGLGTWLAGLPDGLGTVLGAGGTDVSGGERRRLLVARALLAPHRVLLVDEPAEHLDAATADALVTTLADAARSAGRAVVVASHRLSPLATADEVLLLGAAADGGPARVVARGRHADLVRDVPGYGWAAAQEDVQALPATG
jgi:ATP-binding cassette subfamily C protein CydC